MNSSNKIAKWVYHPKFEFGPIRQLTFSISDIQTDYFGDMLTFTTFKVIETRENGRNDTQTEVIAPNRRITR